MQTMPQLTVAYFEFFGRWETPEDDRAVQLVTGIVRQAPDYQTFLALIPPGSEERSLFERGLGSFEEAGYLIRSGLMREDLFFDGWYAMPQMWERTRPYVDFLRRESGNPRLYENFEWLAERASEFWAERDRNPPTWRPLTTEEPTDADRQVFRAFEALWSTDRDDIAREFFAELEQRRLSVDRFMAEVPPGSDAFLKFDRIACAYDQAGTLVKNGILHPLLFLQHWRSPTEIWSVVESWVLALRRARGSPHIYDNLEWLAGYEQQQATTATSVAEVGAPAARPD
jgi:hypothetical protein